MPRGWGFGFHGSSPPWPYIGLGRGGLPRGAYFLSGTAGVLMAGSYQQTPYAASPTFGSAPFAPQATPEQELDFLKNQAEAIEGQLEQIETRIRDLESEK